MLRFLCLNYIVSRLKNVPYNVNLHLAGHANSYYS